MTRVPPTSKPRRSAALLPLAGLLIGLSSSVAQAQTVCPDDVTLNNCGVASTSWPSMTFVVNQASTITSGWYGVYAKWNQFQIDGLTVTTRSSTSDALRTDAAGSFIFVNDLIATTLGTSSDGINVASNDAAALTSPWNIGVIVTHSVTITTNTGMGVRVNAMMGEGGSSIAILPSGSTVRVTGTGTATQGSRASSSANGYAVYAGNRMYDTNTIGTSAFLVSGTNNNTLGNAYAFIGSNSTVSDNLTNGHAVYANKGGLVELGDGTDVSATGRGGYALYAATEQQGSYTTNIRPGTIYLEGGAKLRVTNGAAGSDGVTAIVMQANGANSIIANRAIDYSSLTTASGYTLTGSYNSFMNVLPDKTDWTATHGVFDVIGILSALNGGEIDLNMTAGSSFLGATAKSTSGANPASVIHLDIAGAASQWTLNANSALDTLNLGAGATLAPYRAASELTNFTLQGAVTSSGGIIDLANGAAGETFTIAGSYAGASNAALRLDTVLSDDASLTDKLVVNGDTLSGGTTLLHINNAGGLGAATTGEGILVVQVSGASDGLFALDGAVTAGDYVYKLVRGASGTPDWNNWYLQATKIPPGGRSADDAMMRIPALDHAALALLALLLGLTALARRRR